jgi:hypothetical protein
MRVSGYDQQRLQSNHKHGSFPSPGPYTELGVRGYPTLVAMISLSPSFYMLPSCAFLLYWEPYYRVHVVCRLAELKFSIVDNFLRILRSYVDPLVLSWL